MPILRHHAGRFLRAGRFFSLDSPAHNKHADVASLQSTIESVQRVNAGFVDAASDTRHSGRNAPGYPPEAVRDVTHVRLDWT